ncbi:hypothetical protein ACFYTQ_13000 [Nocardia sp. NPDC004068]|uniref:hypothetical protein n=1 Tax=Nocardia sp. NPDC004068 TaxID=3364303 RepID=UPI00367695CE
MREHLRRSALWADAYGSAEWPFSDIASFVTPNFQLSADVERDLEQYLASGAVSYWMKSPCCSIVRWAALSHSTEVSLPDLPDPYEPMLIMFERGGGYWLEVFIDLEGISISQGSFESNLRSKPFLVTSPVALDAYDILHTSGEPSYYALPPMGGDDTSGDTPTLVRRHTDKTSHELVDEEITTGLKWKPTPRLRDIEETRQNPRVYEIREAEAIPHIEHLIVQASDTEN